MSRLVMVRRDTPAAPPAPEGAMTHDEKLAYLRENDAVFRAVNFNNADLLDDGYGGDYGAFTNDALIPGPEIDGTQLASGYKSIKFTVFSGTSDAKSGAGSGGQFFMNFSAAHDVLYGEGQSFEYQYMVRYSSQFLANAYQHQSGGTGSGWKMDICGKGDPATCTTGSTATCESTNTTIEIVGQNTNMRGFPQMYAHLDSAAQPFATAIPPSNFNLQPGKDGDICSYEALPGTSDCVVFEPDVWITVTTKVTVGTLVGSKYEDCRVERWWSVDGAAAVKIIDYTTDIDCASDGSDKWGKLWLLPYHTEKSQTQDVPDAELWYANPIVSNIAIPKVTVEPETALATLAASMADGAFAELTTTGISGIFTPSAGGSILEYMDRALYNPIDNSIMVQGGAHTGDPDTEGDSSKFVKYSLSTNTWTELENAAEAGFDNSNLNDIGHEYQHDSLDPATGDMYHRNYGGGTWSRFIHSTQQWGARTAIPAGAFQVAGATAYFPERSSIIFIDGDWGVWEYSISGNSWEQLAATRIGGFTPEITPSGAIHNFAIYCAAGPCVVLGGGADSNTGLYRLNTDGSFDAIANAPAGVGMAIPQNGSGSVMVENPVNGNLLVWNENGVGYEYDVAADSWAATGEDMPWAPTPSGNVSNVAACCLKFCGVVACLLDLGSSDEFHLYKPRAA